MAGWSLGGYIIYHRTTEDVIFKLLLYRVEMFLFILLENSCLYVLLDRGRITMTLAKMAPMLATWDSAAWLLSLAGFCGYLVSVANYIYA